MTYVVIARFNTTAQTVMNVYGPFTTPEEAEAYIVRRRKRTKRDYLYGIWPVHTPKELANG